MKILATGDWHADWVTHGVDRFPEIEEAVLGVLVPTAALEKVDAFVFLGDLADPDSGPEALRAAGLAIRAARALAIRSIPSIWIPGNHDVVEDGTGTTTLSPLAAAAFGDGFVSVFERPGVAPILGSRFALLPFTATSFPYDPAEFVRGVFRDADGPVVVAGHMTVVPGVTPGEETTEMPRGRETRFPVEDCAGARLLLNGHYHRRQRVENPGPPFWIPGSLARLTFGEEGHAPGFVIAEV